MWLIVKERIIIIYIYNNFIIIKADYCVKPCHYTHHVRNATCLNGSWAEENEINKDVKNVVKGESLPLYAMMYLK